MHDGHKICAITKNYMVDPVFVSVNEETRLEPVHIVETIVGGLEYVCETG